MDVGYERVATEAELPENGQRLVSVGGINILLCKSEGEVFAVRNRCTHDQEQLAGGVMKKSTIVCPFHGARFSLRSGMPFGPPAFEPLDTFPVRIVDGHIEVGAAPSR